MNKLLKGLPLRTQTGGLVKAFFFTDEAKKKLGAWFDIDAIRRLEDFVEVALDMEVDSKQQPTIGVAREVLTRLSELADALSIVLSQAPEVVRAELTLIGHKSFGDWKKTEKLGIELQTLALASLDQAEKLPTQTRRPSHQYMVRGIAQESQAAGIALSSSEHSKFTVICRCIFEAAGIYQDPRGSIRGFLSSEA